VKPRNEEKLSVRGGSRQISSTERMTLTVIGVSTTGVGTTWSVVVVSLAVGSGSVRHDCGIEVNESGWQVGRFVRWSKLDFMRTLWKDGILFAHAINHRWFLQRNW
jgi:hypothetical protein